MLHICKTHENDVCLKFVDIGDTKYANPVLSEILEQRKNYTESRRNNRKGKKDNNISKTYVKHMVNVNVNTECIKEAFDNLYLDQQKTKWSHIDFDFEYRTFCDKVLGSPDHYRNHDASGLRLAFQSQLRSAKSKPKEQARAPNPYEHADFNKSVWTLEAWEKHYDWKLKSDNDFRKHFGYDELRIGKTVGGNSKG